MNRGRKLINNSPRRTCNNRIRHKSACSGGIRVAGSRRDNSAMRVRRERPRRQKHSESAANDPAGKRRGSAPASLWIARLGSYSTSAENGEALLAMVAEVHNSVTS